LKSFISIDNKLPIKLHKNDNHIFIYNKASKLNLKIKAHGSNLDIRLFDMTLVVFRNLIGYLLDLIDAPN